MPSTLAFLKMHGCGNDYVFVDCFSGRAPEEPHVLAARISDRHTSVGADGLVLMLPADVADADARMRMFNRDGSEGSMCGNALRCFAMWLYQSGRVDKDCRIAMRDRIVKASVIHADVSARTADVSVDMGRPASASLTSVKSSNEKSSKPDSIVQFAELPDVRVGDSLVRLACVSMGNPHAVLFVPDLQAIRFEANGPAIERHAEFPDRTNVEFVQPIDGSRARVRVWERGSGETMACGSGACAVAVAGIATGVFRRDQPVTVEMRGGQLQVTWSADDHVHLRGPAEESFRGELLIR